MLCVSLTEQQQKIPVNLKSLCLIPLGVYI